MKKLTIAILMILTVFGLCACKKEDKGLDLSVNVSHAQTHYYYGENEQFQATVTIGIKEKLFIADGTSTDVCDYATVAVTPLSVELADKNFTYTLVYDGGELAGELKRDPVSHAYTASVDIGDNKDKIQKLIIGYDDQTSEIVLTNKLTDMLTWEQVLEIAKTTLAAEIEGSLTEDGKLPREICVKFIRDKRNPDSDYFWYVSFVSADGGYWALLIEPKDGGIISKKV